MTDSIKHCKYCGAPIQYASTPTRGYWAGVNGKRCTVPVDGVYYNHMPNWNTDTKDWE